jgi:hypothetical protein
MATIKIRASSPTERDADLAAVFEDWNLDSDPRALDLARAAYQEGLDEAMSQQVDTFVRSYLACNPSRPTF